MPLEPFRYVTHPRRWHDHGWMITLGVLAEVLIVLVTLHWQSDLVGSVGVISITLPMMLAAWRVPPVGWIVALAGSGVFVLNAATDGLPIDQHDQLLALLAWTASTYAVSVLVGRTRREWSSAMALLAVAEGEERRRIAADLHDDTVQVIVAAILELEHRADPRLGKVTQLLRVALDRLRTLSFHLRPPDLENGGLAYALPDVCRSFQPRFAAAQCHLTYHIDVPTRCAPLIEEMVHRVLLEALQNTLKHAHSKNIAVTASQSPREIRLAVTDDGRGFDPTNVRRRDDPWQHLGLVTKIERARWVGGRLTIHSTPDEGTTVHLSLPNNPRQITDAVETVRQRQRDAPETPARTAPRATPPR